MKTGFNDLDNIVKIKGGDLIVIASRPAMGKSTLAINILRNVAIKEKKPVLLFSLENSKETIINKLSIRNSMDASIFIDASVPQTINNIFKKSCELKGIENIELIIIDYLQLIQFNKNKVLSRDNEIKEILKMLKTLAKKLDIPIIITSQLSRKPEERNDKRPVITDFNNTAPSILDYADKILFLYRDSYYNKDNKSNMTDIIVAKNENDEIGTIKLEWLLEYCMLDNTAKFEN